jgi:carbamate kinase
MADVLGIRDMMILTRVPRIAIRYGQPDQQDLGRVSLSEVRRYRAEGHFAPGTMGSKVDAAIRFVEGGGRCAIITSLDRAVPALRGETGTHIVPDESLDVPADRAPVAGVTGAGA